MEFAEPCRHIFGKVAHQRIGAVEVVIPQPHPFEPLPGETGEVGAAGPHADDPGVDPDVGDVQGAVGVKKNEDLCFRFHLARQIEDLAVKVEITVGVIAFACNFRDSGSGAVTAFAVSPPSVVDSQTHSVGIFFAVVFDNVIG